MQNFLSVTLRYFLLILLLNPEFQFLQASLVRTGSFDYLNKISFRAYTDPSNLDNFKVVETENLKSLQASGLKPGQKVTIIVHVFLEDLLSTSPSQELKNADLKKPGHQNIIIAHWKRESNGPISQSQALLLYNSVVLKDAPKVGKIIAKFVAFLVNSGGIVDSASSVHLIGFSLGAHIAGSAGRHLQKSFALKVGRITGLDPPGVLFYFISQDEKLDPSDAKFVDVLHTDIVLLGTRERLGHVDFYSNGGKREDQPGCRPGINFTKYMDWVFCGHTSAITIYAQSLSKSFDACECSEPQLGLVLNLSPSPCGLPKTGHCSSTFGENGFTSGARGSFYLKT